jgi:hypothetical protein
MNLQIADCRLTIAEQGGSSFCNLQSAICNLKFLIVQ